MATRSHVSVALVVLIIGSFSSGCIFGWGGKKKAPQASASKRSSAVDWTEIDRRRGGASDDVRLAPQASAVQWPRPEVLRIGDSGYGEDSESQTVRDPVDDPVAREALTSTPSRELVEALVEPTIEAPAPPHASADFAEASAVPDKAQQPEQPRVAVVNTPLDLTTESAPDAEAAEAAQAAAAIPGAAPGAVPAETGVGELARQASQRLRANPTDVAAQLDYQLARFLSDEQVPDLNSMSTLPGEDRELLTALLDGLSNFRNGLRGEDNMLLSRKVRPLLDMAARLRSQSELSIPTVALCDGVQTFGNYKPRDTKFVAGERNRFILYCEVANVASKQNDDGIWESTLSQEVVLYTEAGQRVWALPPQITPDTSRNRRHDFFLAQRITLPPNLTINRYILKVTVEDTQVKRMAEATIPIEVVAQLEPPASVGPIAKPTDATLRKPEQPQARAADDDATK